MVNFNVSTKSNFFGFEILEEMKKVKLPIKIFIADPNNYECISINFCVEQF